MRLRQQVKELTPANHGGWLTSGQMMLMTGIDSARLCCQERLAGHVALIGIGTFTIDHMMLRWHDQG